MKNPTLSKLRDRARDRYCPRDDGIRFYLRSGFEKGFVAGFRAAKRRSKR